MNDHTTTPSIRRHKSRAVRSAVALGLVVASLFASVSSAHAAGWQMADSNRDGYYDVAGMDNNNDGVYDVIWIDTNFDLTWDFYTGYNGNWRQVWSATSRANLWTYTSGAAWHHLDGNGDGRFERLEYDGNNDGTSEWAMIDNNGDGTYDGNWLQIVANWSPNMSVIGGARTTGTSNLLLNTLTMGHNNRMVDIWL